MALTAPCDGCGHPAAKHDRLCTGRVICAWCSRDCTRFFGGPTFDATYREPTIADDMRALDDLAAKFEQDVQVWLGFRSEERAQLLRRVRRLLGALVDVP